MPAEVAVRVIRPSLPSPAWHAVRPRGILHSTGVLERPSHQESSSQEATKRVDLVHGDVAGDSAGVVVKGND